MLSALARSSKTQEAFANEHGFNAHRIGYWRKRIRDGEGGHGFKQATIVGPAQVCDQAATGAATVEFELGDGKTLRFAGKWSRELLEPWVEAIGAMR